MTRTYFFEKRPQNLAHLPSIYEVSSAQNKLRKDSFQFEVFNERNAMGLSSRITNTRARPRTSITSTGRS